ncbi:PEP-CTERM protein-sorting domain-containing protein [Sphingomonas laterariae]|uniref:PEP-CTERM protein-sorting domain-containing protein n=1 Tax=Edaphosphingomonas laterariae TaxID=861865 RepID=A0A239F6Y6_9SPHN|nr:PEPxxWA-CTERM sorting domain-containing protein [Sphingomonas laterariae]SNS52810.1 PEP-CTERM protein-sorting domain-containing protein [Sphingomonas laterariae]
MNRILAVLISIMAISPFSAKAALVEYRFDVEGHYVSGSDDMSNFWLQSGYYFGAITFVADLDDAIFQYVSPEGYVDTLDEDFATIAVRRQSDAALPREDFVAYMGYGAPEAKTPLRDFENLRWSGHNAFSYSAAMPGIWRTEAFGSITKFTAREVETGTPLGVQFSYTAVPEPASWAMMIGGFGMIGATMRRRHPARHRIEQAA